MQTFTPAAFPGCMAQEYARNIYTVELVPVPALRGRYPVSNSSGGIAKHGPLDSYSFLWFVKLLYLERIELVANRL